MPEVKGGGGGGGSEGTAAAAYGGVFPELSNGGSSGGLNGVPTREFSRPPFDLDPAPGGGGGEIILYGGIRAIEAIRQFLNSGAAGATYWLTNWFSRGRAIEAELEGNLGWNFPIIDRYNVWQNFVASIKSIDIRGVSYQGAQGAARLESVLRMYVNNLASFSGRTWAGQTVPDVPNKVLQVVFPANSNATVEQARAINSAMEYASTVGIHLNIYKAP